MVYRKGNGRDGTVVSTPSANNVQIYPSALKQSHRTFLSMFITYCATL